MRGRWIRHPELTAKLLYERTHKADGRIVLGKTEILLVVIELKNSTHLGAIYKDIYGNGGRSRKTSNPRIFLN